MHAQFCRFRLLSTVRFLNDRQSPNADPARRNRFHFRHAQRGSAVVEAAFLLAFFIVILYGIVSYMLPIMLIHTFHEAASAGVRAAVKVDAEAFPDDTSAYQEAATAEAISVAGNSLNWLPNEAKSVVLDNIVVSFDTVAGRTLITVTVSFPNYRSSPLSPVLKLPIPTIPPTIIDIPSLPDNLWARASQ